MNQITNISVTTGEQLRVAKEQLGLSSAGLANALRLGTGGGKTIRRWQSGESSIPGPAQVAIELLLAVRFGELKAA